MSRDPYAPRRFIPRSIGPSIFPTEIVRSLPIAQQTMAMIRGETPIHLAQRFLGQMTNRPILNRLQRRPTITTQRVRRPPSSITSSISSDIAIQI